MRTGKKLSVAEFDELDLDTNLIPHIWCFSPLCCMFAFQLHEFHSLVPICIFCQFLYKYAFFLDLVFNEFQECWIHIHVVFDL